MQTFSLFQRNALSLQPEIKTITLLITKSNRIVKLKKEIGNEKKYSSRKLPSGSI